MVVSKNIFTLKITVFNRREQFFFQRTVFLCFFSCCHSSRDAVFLEEHLETSIVEVWTSRVTKSSYETELRKMTSKFELLTRKIYRNSSFELLTRLREILDQTSSY